MRTNSLIFRLGTAAAALIVLALTLAAFGLQAMFNREIERRAAVELGQVVKTIAAQVRIEPGGMPVLDGPPPDLRFDAPYSGHYWQVARIGEDRSSRSRSLWDFALLIPEDHPNGQRWTTGLQGPNGSALLAVVQDISVPSPNGDVALRIAAALDRDDLTTSQRSMFRLLALSLGALGILLILAMTAFIRLALRPFDDLGRGLQKVHAGASRSIAGRFPDEVQPVVDDLNQMIAFQDAAIERARTQAGDLAHALKTPLAVLGSIARQARGEDHPDVADSIDEQTSQMRRQIDRVLARARAGINSTLGRKPILLSPIANKVVRAFERLPNDRNLTWECDVTADVVFPGDDGDITEMMGNLLDNARKWAGNRVRLSARAASGKVTITVEDDGAGLDPEQASCIVRGQRWDESRPGTGFGLAITRDLAEAYRGSLDLGRSELGGLKASIRIPLASSSARRR